MLKVDMNQLEESDYDPFLDVTYQGKPFTGIGVLQTKNFYSEYTYLNGKGHGTCFSRYTNGQLMEKFVLRNGKQISNQEWYKSGALECKEDESRVLQWLESGQLYFESDFSTNQSKTYYESGELKIFSSHQPSYGKKSSIVYYAKNGDWVFKTPTNNPSSETPSVPLWDGKYMLFNHSVLRTLFYELCFEFDYMIYLLSWLSFQIETDRTVGMKLLFQMLEHEDARVKNSAIVALPRKFPFEEVMPYLEKALEDRRIPPKYHPPFSTVSRQWTRSISESAKRSIEEMKIV